MTVLFLTRAKKAITYHLIMIMNKFLKMKNIYLLALALLISTAGMAQVSDAAQVEEQVKKESKIDKSKLYYGGYASFSFGSYTVIGVTPVVGYKVTPKFSVGGQVSYEYVSDKRYDTDYSGYNYSFSLFSRYRITPKLYAHVEFSEMNYENFYSNGSSKREWVPFLYVGGGYSKRIAKNTYLNAQVLFDVINSDKSPYKDWEPFFSIGIGVGF